MSCYDDWKGGIKWWKGTEVTEHSKQCCHMMFNKKNLLLSISIPTGRKEEAGKWNHFFVSFHFFFSSPTFQENNKLISDFRYFSLVLFVKTL